MIGLRNFNWEFFLLMGLVSIILVSSCHMTYRVRNQHQALEEVYTTPCGSVDMLLEGRGNSKFVFRQVYNPDSVIYVFPDSLTLLYNNVMIPFSINSKDVKLASMTRIHSDGIQIEFEFEIPSGVYDGDTIIISSDYFFECKGKPLPIDTLRFTFKNPVRIHGINSLP